MRCRWPAPPIPSAAAPSDWGSRCESRGGCSGASQAGVAAAGRWRALGSARGAAARSTCDCRFRQRRARKGVSFGAGRDRPQPSPGRCVRGVRGSGGNAREACARRSGVLAGRNKWEKERQAPARAGTCRVQRDGDDQSTMPSFTSTVPTLMSTPTPVASAFRCIFTPFSFWIHTPPPPTIALSPATLSV